MILYIAGGLRRGHLLADDLGRAAVRRLRRGGGRRSRKQGGDAHHSNSGKGEVLLRGVLTLRFASHAQPARLWKAGFVHTICSWFGNPPQSSPPRRWSPEPQTGGRRTHFIWGIYYNISCCNV